MPEQLFGHSWVDFHHSASGVSISFNALDALRGWCKEALPPVSPCPPPQTFYLLCCLSLLLSPPILRLEPYQLRIAGARDWMQTRQKEVQANNAGYLEYDWTFTTPYRGSTCPAELGLGGAEGRAFVLDPHQGREPLESRWAVTDAVIDRQLLMARDPLLLYDEVVLYESELDDNGVSNYSVKVRPKKGGDGATD